MLLYNPRCLGNGGGTITYPPTHWYGRVPVRTTADGKLIPFTEAQRQRSRPTSRSRNPNDGLVLPWPGRRGGAAADIRPSARRQRRRLSPMRRWMPTAFFTVFAGSMIILFGSLRIFAQVPEPAQVA